MESKKYYNLLINQSEPDLKLDDWDEALINEDLVTLQKLEQKLNNNNNFDEESN